MVKVHLWNIQVQSPVRAFGRPPTLMDVVGIGGQFWMMGSLKRRKGARGPTRKTSARGVCPTLNAPSTEQTY